MSNVPQGAARTLQTTTKPLQNKNEALQETATPLQGTAETFDKQPTPCKDQPALCETNSAPKPGNQNRIRKTITRSKNNQIWENECKVVVKRMSRRVWQSKPMFQVSSHTYLNPTSTFKLKYKNETILESNIDAHQSVHGMICIPTGAERDSTKS